MMKAIFAPREGRGEQQGRTQNIYYRPPATSGIYKITCTANKKIYIGSAINLRLRRKDHFGMLRRGKHENPKLQNAWNKYGEQAFTFEVLELVLSMSLTAREQYWFNKLKPFGNKGFNIARIAGSNLGRKNSPEQIEKMKQAQSGRIGMPSPYKGRTSSSEVRERIRQGNLGKRYNTATREKMRQSALANRGRTYILTAPDGTEYVVHGLPQFCQEHPGLNCNALVSVARGRHSHHHGWKASYDVVDGEVAG